MNYKLPNERKSKPLILNMTNDLFGEFTEVCEIKCQTKSAIIRRLIENYIKENKQ